MGNSSASLKFDQSKCSKGVLLQFAFTAIFMAQTTNNVAFFSKDPSDPHARMKIFNLSFKLELDFEGPQAIPVIGFLDREQTIDDLWLPDNPDVTYWHLTRGNLYIRGQEVPGKVLPK